MIMRTPVNAVPARAHAKGSRYHGATLMAYRHAAMDTSEVTTAPHARMGLSANTWGTSGSISDSESHVEMSHNPVKSDPDPD